MINLSLARRYAKALLSIGKEDGRYKEYGEELNSFTYLLEREAELKNAIINPIYPRDDRKKVLDKILEMIQLSIIVTNFINLLFDKQRIDGVFQINQEYQQLVDKLENISRARVTTAAPLGEDVIDRIRQALEKITGGAVVLDVTDDSQIIGGIIAQVGDLVLDGSVRTQLQSLKETLIRGEVA
ncbi:ATP synthase F1 subunit delta [Desulfobacca acetoxidans]